VSRGSTTATEGEPTAETNIVVGSITNAASGDKIGLVVNSGYWYWDSIASTPTGSTIVLANGIPSGSSVNSGAKVIYWRTKAMASLV
jgi:hypothetical protein